MIHAEEFKVFKFITNRIYVQKGQFMFKGFPWGGILTFRI